MLGWPPTACGYWRVPTGYWTGPWTGFCDAEDRCRAIGVLTGHGAYEGLDVVLAEEHQEDSSGQVKQVFDGVIDFGEMPPWPEPLEPTTE